ncbi:MAG: N-acetylmuramoyl-L-alanine amidase, partial [bacterium]
TQDTYQIMIHLKSAKIWGYSCQPEGNRLVFRLKHPPVLQEDSLYKGLTLAIEAGHGGDNYGAVGLSGLLEKDINLDVARKLENIARGAGMEVLQVRESDSYMNLTEKRNAVQNSNAHFLVSIHANATGGGDGYLGVNGVSTYYNNPFWAEFARLVNKNLLELDLKEFGTVGSFNYIVIRLSSRPTILVEQAFMSHAEDEEKLSSESFRQQIAQKIFEGLTEYIQYMYSGDE